MVKRQGKGTKAVGICRNEKKSDTQSTPETDLVANVNKHGGHRSTSQKRKSPDLPSSQGSHNESKRKKKETPTARATGGIMETSFREGDKLVKMSVGTDEEKEFLQESEFSEPEDEESLSQSQESSCRSKTNEPETPENDSGRSEESMDAADAEGPRTPEPGASRRVVSNEIRKIDKEMLIKLRELKTMINKGGLEESAEYFDKEYSNLLDEGPAKSGRKTGINFNNNAAINSEKSIETIYECAVPPKLGNSSDEEGLISDSSNDISPDLVFGCRLGQQNNVNNYVLGERRRTGNSPRLQQQ